MKQAGLSDFLAFLTTLKKSDFGTSVVDNYLGTHRIRSGDLTPYTHFRPDTYGRNLILKTANFEFVVLTWLSDQRTPIHDHAGQRCWMLLQSGTLCFKNYETPERDDVCPVALGCVETHGSGESVYIDDGQGVHSIANSSGAAAVSLHLYAGPVPRCRIYNESAKKFQWVDLTYYTQPKESFFVAS